MARAQLILAISAASQALLWTGVAIVLVIAWWIARRIARRRFIDGGEDGSAAPWTLQQLRDLKARGEISATEYDALRGQMIAEAGGQVVGGYGDSQLEHDLARERPGEESQPPDADNGPAA